MLCFESWLASKRGEVGRDLFVCSFVRSFVFGLKQTLLSGPNEIRLVRTRVSPNHANLKLFYFQETQLLEWLLSSKYKIESRRFVFIWGMNENENLIISYSSSSTRADTKYHFLELWPIEIWLIQFRLLHTRRDDELRRLRMKCWLQSILAIIGRLHVFVYSWLLQWRRGTVSVSSDLPGLPDASIEYNQWPGRAGPGLANTEI